MQQMVNYARKAVDLDPLDADAHLALGYSLTLSGDPKEGDVQLAEALRINPNSFFINAVYACMAHNYGKAEAGAKGADWAMRLNPNFPAWAIPCLRLGMVMVGRYEDVVRIQSRQTENLWNTDGFVIMAGSLAMLGRADEAKALAQRGVAKYPGLLSIERFALNRGWSPSASTVMVDLMRKADFPACASVSDLSDTPNPVRLPECVKT
jgi:tetratricopeptide (TPR) repeat protein